jgi:hypothetical protein
VNVPRLSCSNGLLEVIRRSILAEERKRDVAPADAPDGR